ncbi:MAG: hypothetical protein NW207_01580 [Cytophagales bacterium]|nr:hypothetical protein [Cytophagales bacterium]
MIKHILTFFYIGGLTGMLAGSFFMERHMSFFYISTACAVLAPLIWYLLQKKIAFASLFINFLPFAIIFSSFLISEVIHFQDVASFLKVVNKKSVWVIIPLAFGYAPYYSLRLEKVLLIPVLLIPMVVSAIAIYTYYFYTYIDYQPVITGEHYIKPTLIITHFAHHSLSVMCVCAAIAAYYAMLNNNNHIERMVLGSCCALCIVAIHLIGSRIGIICIYVCVGIYFIWYHSYTGKYLKMYVWILVLVLASCVVVMYVVEINFRTRIGETIDELKYLITGNYVQLDFKGNLTSRLISFSSNWTFIVENFWKGIGVNNYEQVLGAYYNKGTFANYAERTFPPHEWYKAAITMGVPLALLYLIGFWQILFVKKYYKHGYILLVWLTVFIYSNSETALSSTTPYYFCICMLCFAIRWSMLHKEQVAT